MRRRPDGSIQTGNFPSQQNLPYIKDDSIYRCMVTSRTFVGSDSITFNAPNPRVLYDCVILGGNKAGQLLTSCRLSSDLGGSDNYHEIVLTPSTKTLNETPLQDQDGDIVFIQFLQGDDNYPIITSLDNGISPPSGATPEDGVRDIRQFNGVKEETTKTGEFIFTRQSGTEVEERFVPTEGDPDYKLELRDTEKLTETFKSGLIIEKDGEGDKVTVTTSGGVIVDVDGAGNKVSLTAGNTVAEVDGSGTKVTLTAGATIIEVDGLTGKVSLSGALVDIGTAVADLAVLFTALASQYSTHFHLQPAIPGAPPTTPPTAPLLATAASTTVKLQP